jgi:hypothetical protein
MVYQVFSKNSIHKLLLVRVYVHLIVVNIRIIYRVILNDCSPSRRKN